MNASFTTSWVTGKTIGSRLGTMMRVWYCAIFFATCPRMLRLAMVATSEMVLMPGMYSVGLPISVQRPTASSMASSPAIRRMKSGRPRRGRMDEARGPTSRRPRWRRAC